MFILPVVSKTSVLSLYVIPIYYVLYLYTMFVCFVRFFLNVYICSFWNMRLFCLHFNTETTNFYAE